MDPVLEGGPKGFAINDVPTSVPEIRFTDGSERPRTLADFRGKVVLLNV